MDVSVVEGDVVLDEVAVVVNDDVAVVVAVDVSVVDTVELTVDVGVDVEEVVIDEVWVEVPLDVREVVTVVVCGSAGAVVETGTGDGVDATWGHKSRRRSNACAVMVFVLDSMGSLRLEVQQSGR